MVTGASEGIGEAFASELAREGCDLVLVARTRSRLQQVGAELSRTYGVDVEVLVADLTDSEDLARVGARVEMTDRAIDLLVNNAGGSSRHAGFVELDREVIAHDASLNVNALLSLTRAGAGAMVARGSGTIVNVSAGVAFYPLPGAAVYGASKAFVNSLSEAVAHELQDTGVTVTAVCPGFTRTGAQQRLGLRADRVPPMMWAEPDAVAINALRAARRGRRVSSLDGVGKLNAYFGRHLPRRILLPLVGRGQLRLAETPQPVVAAHPTSLAWLVASESRPRAPGVLLGRLMKLPWIGVRVAEATRAPNRMPVVRRWLTPSHARLLQRAGGRLRRSWLLAAGQPVMSLTTTGRRSGQPRSTVVTCFTHGDDLAVAAMNLGLEQHPSWALNLAADPHATIELRGQQIAVTGRRAMGDEADALWHRWVELQPSADVLRALAGREIPLFVLSRCQELA